ncbi:MAG: serine/threonine-protein kinase [Actinophytocola sp.]|uniref:serine/threonine-protein kinase n=1 Tax=Actinophytocola sp. TaxID=1872138 RepID=UPI003D6C2EE6
MDHTQWNTTGTLGDRYVLRTRVGSGRATTVYVADDVRLERRVAVKLFHTTPGEDDLARFAAETELLAGLSHPGLVTVYDVNLDTVLPYLVMRLIDGGPLSDYVDDQDISPSALAQLGAQLADVLNYVHERGIVHGDIDAHNVLIDEQGAGQLTGFGVDHGLVWPSDDIHALGVLLEECLPQDLGPEWRTVIEMMTDPDLDQRPDAVRCGELLRNLAAGDTTDIPLPGLDSAQEDPLDLLAGLGSVTLDDSAAEPPPRKRPAYAGLAGIGLALAALAAVVVTTTTTGPPGEQSGEQRQDSPAEEQDAEPGAEPPAQSYPQAPAQREAPARPSRPPEDPEPPDRSSQTTPPPPPDPGDDGPGNGNGNGNGRGPDGDRDDDDGGLLGDIIGGLG